MVIYARLLIFKQNTNQIYKLKYKISTKTKYFIELFIQSF